MRERANQEKKRVKEQWNENEIEIEYMRGFIAQKYYYIFHNPNVI